MISGKPSAWPFLDGKWSFQPWTSHSHIHASPITAHDLSPVLSTCTENKNSFLSLSTWQLGFAVQLYVPQSQLSPSRCLQVVFTKCKDNAWKFKMWSTTCLAGNQLTKFMNAVVPHSGIVQKVLLLMPDFPSLEMESSLCWEPKSYRTQA